MKTALEVAFGGTYDDRPFKDCNEGTFISELYLFILIGQFGVVSMGTFVIYITMWCVICARKNKDLGEWISLSLKTTFQLCEVNMMSFSNHQFSQRTNARCQIGVSGSHMTSDFMVSVTVYSLAVGAHTWKTTSFATALQVIPIQEDVISVDYSYIPICIP